MHAADRAAVRKVVGAGQNGTAFFREKHHRSQRFQIARGGVSAGMRIIGHAGAGLANGLERGVEVVGARTVEEALGRVHDDAFVANGRGRRAGRYWAARRDIQLIGRGRMASCAPVNRRPEFVL